MIEVGGVPIVGLNLYLKVRDSDRGKIRKIRWYVESLGEDKPWVQLEDAIDSWSVRVEKQYESRRLKVEVDINKGEPETLFSWPILTPSQVTEFANKNTSPISTSMFYNLLEQMENVKDEISKERAELEQLLNVPNLREQARRDKADAEMVLQEARAERAATKELLDEIRRVDRIDDREAELEKARANLELKKRQQDAAFKKNQASLTKQHEESLCEIESLKRELRDRRIEAEKRKQCLDDREKELEDARQELSLAKQEFERDTNLQKKIKVVDAQIAQNATLTSELEDGLDLLFQLEKYGLQISDQVRAAAIDFIDSWIRQELPVKTRATRLISPTTDSPYICRSCNNHVAACACGE